MAYLTCYQTVDMTRAIGAVKVTRYVAGESLTVTAADRATYHFYGSMTFDAAGNAIGTISSIYNYGAAGGLIYTLTGLTYSFAEAVTPTTSDPDAIVFAGDDVIAGSSGNDAIIYYGGNDYFDGGAGTDKIILSGAYADYTISQSAGYTTLTSSGGTVTVVNVESVAFSGGSDIRTLADLVPLTYTASGSTSVNEASGSVIVTVTASTASNTTLGWKVTSTATSGSDFTDGVLPSGTVTLTSGVGSFSLSVLDDAVAEIDEGYTVTVYDLSTGVEVASLSGTIINDDSTSLVLTSSVDSLAGGSQNDLVDGSALGSLGTGDTVSGGDGLDVLSASLAVGSVTPTISGVEVLICSSTAGTAIVDLSASSGYAAVWAGGSSDIAYTNLIDTAKVGIRDYVGATDGTNITFSFASGELTGSSDAVTLTLSAVGDADNAPNVAIAGGSNSSSGQQLVVIVEDGDSHLSALQCVAGATGSISLTSLTIKGSQDLTIDTAVEFATTSGVVNAAQLSGALVITTGSGNESITGGSGNDWLSGGLGDDTMTGGSGADTFVVSNLEATSLSSGDIDTVTDFDASTDLLAAAVVPVGFTDLGSFDGYSDVQSAVRVLASAVGTGNAAQFSFSGSTYVFVGDGVTGLSGGDTLVNVTGLTGTLSAGNFVAG